MKTYVLVNGYKSSAVWHDEYAPDKPLCGQTTQRLWRIEERHAGLLGIHIHCKRCERSKP